MKAKEVREMTYIELNEKLASLKQELFNLRFSHTTGQLADPSQLHKCKKDIARVLTVMRMHEIREPNIKKTLQSAAPIKSANKAK